VVDSVQAVNALYPMQQNTLIEQSGTNKAQNLGSYLWMLKGQWGIRLYSLLKQWKKFEKGAGRTK